MGNFLAESKEESFAARKVAERGEFLGCDAIVFGRKRHFVRKAAARAVEAS